jgi:thioredoxin-dependent peroxiredoxin
MSAMRALALTALIVAVCAARPVRAELLRPGDPFPDWALPDQTGKVLSAKDLAGKSYLLWFYPRAMTPGCTTEGRQLRDRFADFQRRGVEVLGVSFDAPEKNAEFVRAEGFPFRLLSDQQRTLAVAVGAARSTDQSAAARISYLVGPDGKVKRAYAEVSPGSHAGQVLDDLAEEKP